MLPPPARKSARVLASANYEITFDAERHMIIPLVMTNGGRTFGIIKEISYAFLERTFLPATRDAVDWEWTTMEYDWAIKPEMRRPIRTLKSPFIGIHRLVCYLRYEVILTKQTHHSWMGMYVDPANREQPIIRGGGDTWNYCD